MNRSIGNVVLIYGVCVFASWSLLCYLMVLLGLGFSDLKLWSVVAVIVGFIFGTVCNADRVSLDAAHIEPKLTSTLATPRQIFWSLFAVTIVATILRLVDAPYWLVWIALLSAAILAFRASSTWITERDDLIISKSKWQWLEITTLVICGMMLVAITHRPDLDDAQYLNFVVTAIDFPSEPLFSRSGLWQDQSVPLELPIYRFHTYELLVAVLSDVLRVDHKILYYLVLAPIFGGIAILVHWRLAQYLIPHHALSMLIIWLVLIIALGESHREFGNFAFVRLFQGKALLVTVTLPICLLLGLQFAEAPDWRRVLALSMAAIASLGMSSSALAVVPFLVAATLSGGLLSASRASVKLIVAGGLIALLLLIAIGVALLTAMNIGGYGTYGDFIPNTGNGLSIILGDGILGSLILALFPVAPLFVTDFRRRRLYATTTLMLVVGLLNPWTAAFLAKMLDGAFEWRLFWSVPFVLSASISLAGLAALAIKKVPRGMRHAVLPTISVALLLFSNRLSLSPDNQVVIAFPHYKVDMNSHALASEIVRDAPKHSTIYAPIPIAALITTFRQHPYPLIVRHEYLGFEPIQSHFGISELNRRRRVIDILEGNEKNTSTATFFQAQLAHDRPAFVVYEGKIEMAPVIGAALSAGGYVGEKRGTYWLWHRH